MIELKTWRDSLTSENGSRIQTTPKGHRRPHGNPLHLVNKKAKELATLLGQYGKRVWVGEAVCFTNDGLRVRLPAHDQNGVHTVAELVEMLKRPPRDASRRIDATRSREVESALERIGIRRSDAEYKIGPYQLERRSFDSGPAWADYLAAQSELPEAARVRIYLRERGSDASVRQSVENAARREAAVLRRFRHPGALQVKQYDPSGHSAGPALIFDYHPHTLRLDEYLLQYGEKLDVLDRTALVRQLAETMRSAHSSRIHHRALAARSVHAILRNRGRRGRAVGEEAAGLTPHLQISDWQIATQRSNTDSSSEGLGRFAPTALSAMHLSDGSDPYLAPSSPRSTPTRCIRTSTASASSPICWSTDCPRTSTSWCRQPPPTAPCSGSPPWTSAASVRGRPAGPSSAPAYERAANPGGYVDTLFPPQRPCAPSPPIPGVRAVPAGS